MTPTFGRSLSILISLISIWFASCGEEFEGQPNPLEQRAQEVQSQLESIDREIEALSPRLTTQQLLLDDIRDQQMQLELEARIRDAQTRADLRSEQSIILAELQNQLASQTAHVSDLQAKVRRETDLGFEAQEFEETRTELAAQQALLAELQEQYYTTQARISLERERELEQRILDSLNRRFAMQSLQREESAALIEFQKLALPGSVWVEAKAAAMKKNRDPVFFKIPEAA